MSGVYLHDRRQIEFCAVCLMCKEDKDRRAGARCKEKKAFVVQAVDCRL